MPAPTAAIIAAPNAQVSVSRICSIGTPATAAVSYTHLFRVISRQKTLSRPIRQTKDLYDAGLDIIFKSWDVSKPIRLLSLTAAGLTESGSGGQFSFFDAPQQDSQKIEKLETAIDEIRKRFGKKAVSYGSILKTDIVSRQDVPLEKEEDDLPHP